MIQKSYCESISEVRHAIEDMRAMAKNFIAELEGVLEGVREDLRKLDGAVPAEQYGLVPGTGGPPSQGEMWNFSGHDPD